MLDQKSFEALRLPQLPPIGAIRFAADFSPEEIGQSAVARNALILLHSASVGQSRKESSDDARKVDDMGHARDRHDPKQRTKMGGSDTFANR